MDLFDIDDEVIYLNSAGAGPRLHSVNQAAQSALLNSARPWAFSPDQWLQQTESLRALAAQTLGTHADALAFCPSVSYAMALAANHVTLGEGDSIVTLAREYPSNRAIWQQRAAQCGARLRSVDRAPGQSWTAAVLAAVDERSKVLSLPPCHWADGASLDLVKIGKAARANGSLLVVDASQWLGAAAFDFAAIKPDFVMTPGHKWLLGAYGLGWLWASERWRNDGEPLEQTVFAREAFGDFTALGDQLPPYRAGARRFDFGPYPHPLSVPMSAAALRQISAWGGVESVTVRLRQLNDGLRHQFEAQGLGEGLSDASAPHLCAWRPPDGAMERVLQILQQRKVIVARRGAVIRLAPHLHISEGQLTRVAQFVASAV